MLWRILNEIDFTYYPVIPLSIMFFLFVYAAAPEVSMFFVKKYCTIEPPGKKKYWCNQCVSLVHALIVSSSSVYVVMFDEGSNKDLLWSDSPLIFLNCAIVSGYMLADLIIVHFNRDYVPGRTFFILHHCASILGYMFVVSYRCCGWFANARLLAEISTPFVNMKFFLEAAESSKTSNIYMLNGLLFTIMFFSVRIVTIPWYYYQIYSIYGTEGYLQLGKIAYVLYISSIGLDTINLYWFRKIFRGCLKVLKARSNKMHDTGNGFKLD